MSNVVVIAILLLSLASWPLSVGLSHLSCMKNPRNVIITGVVLILATVTAVVLLFKRYFRNVDPMMYVFSLFSIEAGCSLFTALELDGYIKDFKPSNVSDVEPYLKTAHGTIISYWNGIVHVILCLAAVALYSRRDSHREVSLYWAGSILNSMIVLLPSCLTGHNTVKNATLFNVISVVAALVVVFYYIERKPVQARSFLKFPPIWKRPVDLIFLIYYLAAIGIVVFRGLAVLGGQAKCMKDYLKAYEPYLNDPSGFPKFQAITYEYFFLVYYLCAVYGLLCPGQHWMSDWSLFHAGAGAQAQFSYIAGAMHHRTSKSLHPARTGAAALIFWGINLTMFVMPHLFAWWCQRDPEKYGRTYTQDLATPVQTYTLRRSARLQKKGD